MTYLILLWTGCVPEFDTQKADTFVENPAHDFDGDGFTEQGGDCNDNDATQNPQSEWFIDVDGDGYGFGQGLQVTQCEQPPGFVANNLDCDDNDAEMNATDEDGDGTSSCDGDCDDADNTLNLDDSDNDGFSTCSGDCDEQDEYTFPGAAELESTELCMKDVDGDGYGSMEASGNINHGTDCDDSNNAIYPHAMERCSGAFENCNHPLRNDTEAPTDETDDDGDGYVECNYQAENWVGNELIVGGGDCNDANANVKPGGAPSTSPTACLGDANADGFADRSWTACDSNTFFSAGNLTSPLEQSSYQFIPNNGFLESYYRISTGDIDGDGLDDVLISDLGQDLGIFAGWTYLILGSKLQQSPSFALSNADYIFTGSSQGDFSGRAISISGDVDGDGFDDILIGAPNADTGASYGKAYLIFATSLGTHPYISLEDADYIFSGENEEDTAGNSVSLAQDIDGDGLNDILIGAYNNDDAGSNAGKAYLVLGSSLANANSREISLADADYAFLGEQEQDMAGLALSSGDFDGDGRDDLLIGSNLHDAVGLMTDYGKSYLIFGKTLGDETAISLSDADYSFVGESEFDYAGNIHNAGDVDGDGRDDILIGAPFNSDPHQEGGRSYLILSSSLGSTSTINLADADFIFTGENPYDMAGNSLDQIERSQNIAAAGDIDGDGLGDILIGAPGNSDMGQEAGKIYLFLGASLGSTSVISLADADYFFIGDSEYVQLTLQTTGDLNGDGLNEFLFSGANFMRGFSACTQ